MNGPHSTPEPQGPTNPLNNLQADAVQTCYRSGTEIAKSFMTNAIDQFCQKMDGLSGSQNDYYYIEVKAGWFDSVEISVTLTNKCTVSFTFKDCKSVFVPLKDCHKTAALAVGGYIENHCWRFNLDPKFCIGCHTDFKHTT